MVVSLLLTRLMKQLIKAVVICEEYHDDEQNV